VRVRNSVKLQVDCVNLLDAPITYQDRRVIGSHSNPLGGHVHDLRNVLEA